jgi:Cysteine-rich secretory protein family
MLRITVPFAAIVALCLVTTGACSSSKAGSTSGPHDGAATEQDAPSNGDGAGGGDSADDQPYTQFQVQNLDVVNMYRATLNVPPLVLDHELCAFALAGSQELSMDHMPHQHIIDAINDNTLMQDGFGSEVAENQGNADGWMRLALDPTTNETDQVNATLQYMFNEGPPDDGGDAGGEHDHYVNMMNPVYTRLGVGLLEVGGLLYLTNDFSN